MDLSRCLVSLIFLLTIPHRFSMGFRSGAIKHSNTMVIETAFGTFGSVGRCQVLLENEISISIKQKEAWSALKFPGRWLRWLWTSENTVRINAPDETLGGTCLQSCQSQCRGYKNSRLPHSFRWFFQLSSPIPTPPLSFHDCLLDFWLETNISLFVNYKPHLSAHSLFHITSMCYSTELLSWVL